MKNESGYEIENELDLFGWEYGDVALTTLQEWVENQITQGKTKLKLDISWGYYHDIDGISLIAEE
jgi:hypothetical protein